MQRIVPVLPFLLFMSIPLTHCARREQQPNFYFKPIPFTPENIRGSFSSHSRAITPPHFCDSRSFRKINTPLQPELEHNLSAPSDREKVETKKPLRDKLEPNFSSPQPRSFAQACSANPLIEKEFITKEFEKGIACLTEICNSLESKKNKEIIREHIAQLEMIQEASFFHNPQKALRHLNLVHAQVDELLDQILYNGE